MVVCNYRRILNLKSHMRAPDPPTYMCVSSVWVQYYGTLGAVDSNFHAWLMGYYLAKASCYKPAMVCSMLYCTSPKPHAVHACHTPFSVCKYIVCSYVRTYIIHTWPHHFLQLRMYSESVLYIYCTLLLVSIATILSHAVNATYIMTQAAASASLLKDLLLAAEEGRLHDVQSLLDGGRCEVNDEDEVCTSRGSKLCSLYENVCMCVYFMGLYVCTYVYLSTCISESGCAYACLYLCLCCLSSPTGGGHCHLESNCQWSFHCSPNSSWAVWRKCAA